jgi:nitrate reductase gamma subunit
MLWVLSSQEGIAQQLHLATLGTASTLRVEVPEAAELTHRTLSTRLSELAHGGRTAVTVADLILGVFIPYTAIAVLVVGSIVKLLRWIMVPLPFPVAIESGRRSWVRALGTLAGELVLFRSLFRSDRMQWLVSWVFHVSILVVALGHLRYFLYPVHWSISGVSEPAVCAGALATLSLVLLLVRRACIDRLVYITRITDLFGPAVFLMACGTGLLMCYLRNHDMVQVKAFSLGITAFRQEPLPSSPLFLVHFVLGCTLATVFPLGRLFHALAWLVSPSRTSGNTCDV